ncbi:DUF3780 domain-containing protein [Caldicellulosiruptoraceae bacterium PP1]
MDKNTIGFGFNPKESEHHFLVIIPKSQNSNMIIYERFVWQYDKEQQVIDNTVDKAKVELSKAKWKLIENTLKNEFNKRLKEQKLPVAKWQIGQNIVHRLFGKEMVLLAWAIEDCEISLIPIAIKNWLGLSPEERWWLFTMTNAATGNLNDKRGWRKAIKYALTENPIEESIKQLSIFEINSNRDLLK